MTSVRVGVLALQGDVAEHLRLLEQAGARAVKVRTRSELARVDGLVLPGGESTTIVKLAAAFDMLEPLRTTIKNGLPVFGSCAGMILLADRIVDGIEGQETLGGLDVVVKRNAFGRQVDSFETDLEFAGSALCAVFIRAPEVQSIGPDVEVLAQVGERIVAVRQGPLLATSFHPELTGDERVHRYFVDVVRTA
ncbi:MAG: pyridoxal 5'-phosphate synthase glutaminase subunit PdxT [Sporichthyaceae bacterium]